MQFITRSAIFGPIALRQPVLHSYNQSLPQALKIIIKPNVNNIQLKTPELPTIIKMDKPVKLVDFAPMEKAPEINISWRTPNTRVRRECMFVKPKLKLFRLTPNQYMRQRSMFNKPRPLSLRRKKKHSRLRLFVYKLVIKAP